MPDGKDENPEESEEESGHLQMSDEDFLNAPFPEESVEETEQEEEATTEKQEEETETPAEDEPANTDDSEESNAEEPTQEDTPENSKQDAKDDGKSDKETEAEAISDIDYKAEYEKLVTPFKANHKNIQVNNVDDAINLMRMGANYNKKMQGLKPNLKLMKMLENNDLLSEEKLSYLIDLNKKNPEAVKNLLKDSGLDPLDIDLEKEIDYKPATYTVNDNEVELDTVLDDIRETESFNTTIDIISNKMDESSKQVLLKEPKLIQVINDQVQSGIYGQIMGVVDNERMLGRLAGLSDLEAYKTVGDAIHAKGGFNKQTPNSNSEAPAEVNQNNSAQESKRKAKKKAASNTKSNPVKSKKDDFNPLAMSDEEFEKATANTFI